MTGLGTTETETRVTVDRHAPIRRLSPLVAAQIAAGEVIERPASVVKELLDNAIDAGATRIDVELEQGGVELVRVADDGRGIAADELPLAVAAHATSKITDAADLDRITTLGFRGEALASIASVSRMSIRSRRAADAAASLLRVEGAMLEPVRPDAGGVGTVVTVRNLFFNTPARRKFLRTPATEQGHCVDTVRQIAMCQPSVAFSVRVEGRLVLDVPAGQQPRDRVLAVVGPEMQSEYLEVHADTFDDARGVALWGLVGKPGLARPTTKWQHLFLGGRPIRDKTVQHALKEAYRGLIEPSRHPAAVLILVMDPGAVDVNVHPAKAEVRFRDSGMVHSVVFRAVRGALQRADLTPAAQSAGPGGVNGSSFGATGPVSRFEYSVLHAAAAAATATGNAAGGAGGADTHVGAAVRDGATSSPGGIPRPVATPRVLQVHNSYLVTQDEQGVLIIDQHALHERVMFEKLAERVSSGPLESQRLLVPVVIEGPAPRLDALERLGPLLERLGIEASPMGPASIGVSAFPSFLFDRRVDAGEFTAELLDRASAECWGGAESTAQEAALADVLDMMACKAAVKAGDALSEEELGELLRLRERVERSSNCPHGRPTTIRMTIRELEKRFGR
ncbi:MAG: DNA mismatch repair endonuclease MutL [Planctomycetota bacterium]|nr:DNA mismatch repair endonuclease MutL [Planctomycetota bacterium]